VTPADWTTLADRFALGSPRGAPRYVARGAMGEVWRLDTTTGRWAVKWQFPWAPDDPRPADLEVQAEAARAGIPLPRPVTTRDGDGVISVGGRPARAYAWSDLGDRFGQPAPLWAAAQAGHLLGLLHALALPATVPVDPWYAKPPKPATWPALIVRAERAGASWAGDLTALQPLLADLAARAVPPAGMPVVCHRDFNPANVFPAAGDARSLVVLDWENSGPLDPRCEVAGAVLEWAYGGQRFDAGAARALLAGYASAGAPEPRLDESCFATSITTRLNLVEVMADQALTDPEHRRYAGQRLASLFESELPDLARGIDAAVAAVSSR
jgi:Ser/Thr protein kinase RdoA (MazF antagonist)